MKILNVNDKLETSTLEFFLKAYIRRNIPLVPPKYTYANEVGVNPAFQSIDEIKQRFVINDKRIFVLRSDLILATGVKNAYQEHGYQGLQTTIAKENHSFINWEDRYGHPSLAIADNGYEGGVLYAGFVCQRHDHLEVFLSSGRYNRQNRMNENIEPLSCEQRAVIENYLTLKLTQAYGKQTVHFYDTSPGKEDDEDSALFFTDTPFPSTKSYRIYDENSVAEAGKLALIALNYVSGQQYIQNNITAIKPKYRYDNEGNINPGFQNIEQIKSPLQLFEKRIWALRTDFILAVGVKNAYQEEHGYHGLEDSFSKSVHQYLDWKDRYGHLFVTLPEQDYDGSAYYAGYLCQRKGFLQVYLVSGRFDRTDLNLEQTKILEAYIAAQLQVAYGQQTIIFDYGNPDDPSYHKIFFANGIFAKNNPQRIYSSPDITSILENASQLLQEQSDSLSSQFEDDQGLVN